MHQKQENKSEINAFFSILSSRRPETDNLDLNTLISMFKHHGLLSYADYLINNDKDLTEFFHQNSNRFITDNLNMQARYELVLSAFKDAIKILDGFDWILIKGLVLCQLYPEPWMRNPGDIDIVIEQPQFQNVARKFREDGWLEQETVHWKKSDDIAEKYGFARVFKHPKMPVTVDLHRHFVDETELFPISQDIFFNNRRHIEIDKNLNIQTLSHEYHLLLIALHCLRHGTFRPGWFLDVILYHQRYGREINKNRILKLMQKIKVFRAVNTAHWIADYLFESKTVFCNRKLDWISQVAIRRRNRYVIFDGHLVPSSSIRRIVAMVDIVDDVRDLLKYLLRVAFPKPSLIFGGDQEQLIFYKYLKNRSKALFSILNFRKKSIA